MMKMLSIFLACLAVTGVTSLSDDDFRVYMVAYMNITTDDSLLPQFQSLHVSASTASRYRIEVPSQGIDEYDDLLPNSIINPQFTEKTWEVDLTKEHTSETNFNSFRIVSQHKVDLFGYKATKGSTDGFMGHALTAESTMFFIPSFVNVPQGHSSFLVVSPYKDACIEATFVHESKPRRLFFRALDEFEVFQTYSQDEDYTGVLVNSTRPVAVFAGHECAQVPVNVVFCDHLIEQVPPVSEWGSMSIVGPILGRDRTAGYLIRVLLSQATDIEILDESGAVIDTATKNMGEYHQFEATDSRMSFAVRCSVPCMVAQYNTGYYKATGSPTDVPTDPFMTIITPTDHFTNYMSFGTARYWYNSLTEPFASFLTVVASDTDMAGIRLNNAPLTSAWTPMTGLGYALTSFAIPAGNFTLYHTNPAVNFVGYVYGHSNHDPTAYGYPVGYDIKGSPIPGTWWEDFFTEAPPTQATCTGQRTLPPDAIRGLDQMFQTRSFLKFEAVTPDCLEKYKIVLEKKAEDIKDVINNLICIGTLCPDTEYAYASQLSIVAYNPAGSTTTMTSFDVDVELATSIDESIGGILRCKRSIVAFLQQTRNWNMPTPVINCPEVDLNDVILLTQQFNCPAPNS